MTLPTAQQESSTDRPASVPPRALVLSVLALAVPLAAGLAVPEWMSRDGALLVWLPAVLPAFLLAYYRGWHGASLALAGAMATLALTQVEILVLDLETPPWEVLLAVVAVLLAVSLGAGWMAETLHAERSRAEQAALSDPLTGLPNRRHASVVLDVAWARAIRGGHLAVIFFDLDHFKRVNDRHGHAEGDRVLKAFADILIRRTRRMDVSARWGGEEFVTILSDCPMDEAARVAEEIRGMLAAIDFGWGHVTASAGVSAREEGMGSPEVLLAAADRALYQAKRLGRDRIHRADQPMAGRLVANGLPGGRSESSQPRPTGPEGLRVLLVDDDPVVLDATTRLLERLGCEVDPVSEPRTAIQRLTEGEPPHVIVTDVIMPQMSGFTLVDLASRVIPDIPALYVSGYPQEEVYWGGSPGARSTFLAKPLEARELERALRTVLGGPDPEEDGPGGDVGGSTAPLGEDAAAAPSTTPAPGTGAYRPASEGMARTRRDQGRRGRILLVDDEESVVRALQKLLSRAGYPEPLGLTDPTQVFQVVDNEEVDLLILDLHMPGLDGFQVLEGLPEHLGEGEYLPVLILTGDDDPALRRRALDAGAHDFLRKPFDVAEARARVNNLLETRFLNQRVARQRDEMEDRVRERTAELADTRTEILHRLARAAEYRDDVTGRHAERVGLLSSLLAAELGFPHREVDIIRRTAPLHDIGKIGIPDAVLRKPGRLTPSEFELMKTHTLIGEEILGGGHHQILRVAAQIALSHHEHWDGGGYPQGLAGEEIPIAARVVSVADTFDVLSHNRPYKDAHPVGDVIDEIRRCRGTQFDPEIVAAFDSICRRVGPDGFTELLDPLEPGRDIYSVSDR